jgi:hypothetical protein
MQKISKVVKGWLDAVFFISGLISVSVGAFFIATSAGFIVAGLCLVVLALVVAKKQAG